MKKRFNITGTCYPQDHYMMDNSKKLEQIMELIEYGEYFTINRPRQYGKTTALFQMVDRLKDSEKYLPIKLNFQGTDEKWHKSDEAFAQMFIQSINQALKFTFPKLAEFLQQNEGVVKDMDSLSILITELVHQTNKKLVLLIDEVDASSNYEPFLKLLATLRTKYLNRKSPQHATFHSIVLAGVHDIKSLKFKLRNPDDANYNSPWNIAVDFKVRMSFNAEEIAPMLEAYSKAEGVKMDIAAIAERLYYYTSGYPFLVSKLCKNMVEDVLPNKVEKEWTLADIETAVQQLLTENNTNFDSLIKNLENNPDLYNLVNHLLIEGKIVPFNQHNPIIAQGILYGIFKRNGQVKVHNRIYQQVVYNYLTSKILTAKLDDFIYGGHFILEDGSLDMQAVLLKFQQFMKEQCTKKHGLLSEYSGRKLFLAFLSPILNGKGYAFREVETSEEKRMDIVITYLQFRYIIELKKWYGQKYHEKGLLQLADYLDIHGVKKGYLVIFDERNNKQWQSEEVTVEGKEVFGVWV